MSDYDNNDKQIFQYAKENFAKFTEENGKLVFHIARSKNKNIVVYEAQMDGENLAATPLTVYWLDIDPEYQAAARKKGKTDDRAELNMIENSMAYGLTTVDNKDGTFDVALVALPKGMKVTLKVVNGKPGCYALINGKMARLTSVFAKSVERTFLPPKCLFVDIYGIDEETGEEVTERIVV